MNNLTIALFAYNFPHRKTVDFIQKIYASGFKIALILAADFVSIKSEKSAFNFPRKEPRQSVNTLAKKHKIPLVAVKHNSETTLSLLKDYNINLGIISGARILNKSICISLKYGVLNFHPGILPFVRGLDSILWSIEKGYSLGVTAHLINEEIDAGYLVCQKILNIEKTDDIYTLYEKNYQLQLDLIPISLNLIRKEQKFKFLKVGQYNSKMAYSKQLELIKKIGAYIRKQSIKNEQKN